MGKHLPRFFDLHTDFWQVGELHRRAIFIDQGFQVNTVVLEVIILYIKSFLGKIKGLIYQITVGIVHRVYWSRQGVIF
jgi:hypothetical protein